MFYVLVSKYFFQEQDLLYVYILYIMLKVKKLV